MALKKSLLVVLVPFLTFHCIKSYDSLYNEAVALKNHGKQEESRKAFEKAAAKKQTPEVFKEIANYYIETAHDYDMAESFLQKSLKLDAQYPNAIHNMGLVYLKRYEESADQNQNQAYLKTAEEWFSRNLSQNPNFALTYAEAGMVLFYQKNTQGAIEKINDAISKGANNSYAHLLLGKVYFFGPQDYKRALESFRIAYNDFSRDPYLLKIMAQTHQKLNQIEDARTYYRKYIKSLLDSGAPEEVIKKAQDEEALLIAK